MKFDGSPARCPDCDGEFEKLGIHWARSRECDYPVLTPDEEAVLDGLMFVGGSLNNRQRSSNCYVSMVHHDRGVLEWIADQLGVISASITEWDKNQTIEYLGRRPDSPLWEFRTRSLPDLDRYYDWYDANGDRTIPEAVEQRPLLLKTACLLAARPMSDRPGLYLSVRRTSPPPLAIHRVFSGYGPRIVRPENGGYLIRLNNSTDLCNDLAPWPAFAQERFDAARYREGAIVCPRCGGRFRRRAHLCEYVSDGEVVREEDAKHEGSWEVLETDGLHARIRLTEDEPPRLVSWTEADCIDALLEEYGAAGRMPLNDEYQAEQVGRSDLPSLGTLYRRFGDREAWLEAMRTRGGPPTILNPEESLPDGILARERKLLEYYGEGLPEKQRADLGAVLEDGQTVPERASERDISRKVAYKNVRAGREKLREVASKDGIEWAPSPDSEYPFPD